jgi:DNA (cytosine-5)-methyltransferase 1
MALTVGSLFAGIGGFDLGLERAGMRTVWFCEQDEFCQRVLAKHWPGVPCHPNVRALVADAQVAGREARGSDGLRDDAGSGQGLAPRSGAKVNGGGVPVSVPPVDVLCGGFPCQDISLAGRGAGIGGERSGLWGQYARLVGELRPRYVLVENVSALLARGLDVVLADLHTLGYDAEWDCLPASAFGAPHRRDRIWLVAYPNSESEPGVPVDAGPGRGVVVQGGTVGDPESNGRGTRRAGGSDPAGTGEREPVRSLQDVGYPASGGRDGPSAARPGKHKERQREGKVGGRGGVVGGEARWVAEPDVGRVAHGVPDRVDRLRALGNALVPQIAEWIGRRIIEWEGCVMDDNGGTDE